MVQQAETPPPVTVQGIFRWASVHLAGSSHVRLDVASAVEAGATNGGVMGPEAVSCPTYKFDTTGLLQHVDGSPGSSPRRELHSPGSCTLSLEGTSETNRARSPSLAAALVSLESFTFDDRTAVTAYERYLKGADGGWTWGNSALMNDKQKVTLQITVHSRKSASPTSWRTS